MSGKPEHLKRQSGEGSKDHPCCWLNQHPKNPDSQNINCHCEDLEQFSRQATGSGVKGTVPWYETHQRLAWQLGYYSEAVTDIRATGKLLWKKVYFRRTGVPVKLGKKQHGTKTHQPKISSMQSWGKWMRHGVLQKDARSTEICKLSDQSIRNLNQLHQNQFCLVQ